MKTVWHVEQTINVYVRIGAQVHMHPSRDYFAYLVIHLFVLVCDHFVNLLLKCRI